MNKLIGTSGQLFSVLAKINSRATVRSGNGSDAKATLDSSFRDLLHTVPNRAKRASSDQGVEGSVNPRTVRAHAAQLTEGEQLKDDIGRERPEAAKEPDPSNQVRALDHNANKHVQNGMTHASIVGQEHAVMPELSAQAQQPRGESGRATGRAERSSSGRDLAGASTMTDSAAQSSTRTSIAAALQEARASHNPVAPTSAMTDSAAQSGTRASIVAVPQRPRFPSFNRKPTFRPYRNSPRLNRLRMAWWRS